MKISLPLIALTILPAVAVAEPSPAFYEKYTTPISRNELGAQVENAALARMGDIYNNRIQPLLGLPNQQARMSELAIQETLKIAKIGSYGLTNRERALQLLAWVNDDAHPYESVMGAGPISAKIAFSPSHNVTRISWSNVNLNGILCYKRAQAVPGGGISQETFRLTEEAQYRVYRNNTLIATIQGAYGTAKDVTISIPQFTLGPISFRLKGSIVGNPQLQVSETDPVLYDFDPYQGAMGAPVRYKIEAWLKGCTNDPEGIPSAAGGLYSSGDLWLDSDGDSFPDFVPVGVVSQKRAAKPEQPVAGATQLTLKINPLSLNATVNDTAQATWQVSAVPSGGVPPYTFRWARTTGVGWIVSSDNAGNAVLGMRPPQCEMAEGEFQAVITDSVGAVAVSTVLASVSSRPSRNYCP